jgi:hypothetical protein
MSAGQAVLFRADMERFVALAARDIPNAFESEEYASHGEAVTKDIQEQKRQIMENLGEEAHKLNFAIQPSASGLLTIPLHEGKPMSEKQFIALKPEEKESINATQQKLETTIESVSRQMRNLDKNAAEALQKLDREVTLYAIKHLVNDIQQKYQDVEAIQSYLDLVQNDILDHISDFKPETEEQQAPPLPFFRSKEDPLKKYNVNILVDNSGHQGAPVVIERNPTYNNLFGKIEQEAQFGALTTDFILIRSGSLHKANGGYLMLPIEEVIASPPNCSTCETNPAQSTPATLSRTWFSQILPAQSPPLIWLRNSATDSYPPQAYGTSAMVCPTRPVKVRGRRQFSLPDAQLSQLPACPLW